MPKYNGTTKPEDWLVDYTTAIGIAGDNKRIAVRYTPLMLQGSAQTWLNSLPPNSVNAWLDFEGAFVRNFTGMYQHLGRPRQLSLCVQGKDETDRGYITRWSELRNSYEGVHEVQAIQYFSEGCRDGTMVKHKLMRTEPATMVELMAIADKYATADSAMQKPLRLNAAGKLIADVPVRKQPAEAGSGSSRRNQHDRHGKRKDKQPDGRYGSRHVAAVEEERPVALGSWWQKAGDRPWRPKFTFE
jgi:hypothetical protein